MTVQPKRRSFHHFASIKVLSSLSLLVLLSPPVPTFSQSTLPGCHPPFSPSETYSPSSLVSVDSVNYRCVDTAYALYCSGAGNAPPGAPGSFASVAWTNLGPCDGDATTTSSSSVPSDSPSGSPSEPPSDDRGDYLGACPRPFDSSVVYSAGDVVSAKNDDDSDPSHPFSSVHRCKSWPYSSFCSIYNFRPGTPNGSLGWTLVGWCDNSVSASPTSTPTWAPHTPGCPARYVPGRVYDAGDRVAYDPDDDPASSASSAADTIYECSPVYSRHCPYRPPEIVAGEEAWIKLGKCRGTIAPTAGPTESWPTWSPTVDYGRFVAGTGSGSGSGGEVDLEGSLHLVLFEEKDPNEGGRRRRLDEVDLDMDVVVLNYLQDNIGGEFTFETSSVQSTERDSFELLVDPRNATMDEILVVANVWKMNLTFSMTEGFRNWIVDYHDGDSTRRHLGDFDRDEDEDEDEDEGDEYQDEEEAGYEFQGDDDEHPHEYQDEDSSHGIVFSSRRLASACSPSDYTMCCSSKSLSSKESNYCKRVGCSSSGCKRKSTSRKKKKKRRNKKNRFLQQQEPLPQHQQQHQRRRHLEDSIEQDLWGLDFLDVVRNYTRYDPTDVFALLNATDTTDVAVCGANRYVEFAEIQDPYFSCDVYESNDCSNNEDVVLENADGDDDPNSVCSPGCPPEYVPGTPYDEGDQVAIDGIRAYECTSPFHSFCRQFGPEHQGGSQAWTDLGSCTGDIAPTSPPTFSPDTPGCPDPYDPSGTPAYQAGDRVSVDGNRAYACKSGNYGAFCNAGSIYAPGGPYSNLGWDDLGSCHGTLDPTFAPTVDPLAPPCPPEYSPSTAYGGGDEVAAKGIAYMCKMDAYSAFCNAGSIYAPGGTYSNLGWERVGSCRYSSASSPAVSSLSSKPTSLPPTPTFPPTPRDTAFPSLTPTLGPSSYPSGLPSENPTL